jgi:hypothetical protein
MLRPKSEMLLRWGKPSRGCCGWYSFEACGETMTVYLRKSFHMHKSGVGRERPRLWEAGTGVGVRSAGSGSGAAGAEVGAGARARAGAW